MGSRCREDGARTTVLFHLASLRSRQNDYSTETPTLVEFGLEKTPTGTLLRVTESGFDKIPSERRVEALRMNDGGWVEQMKNIEAHVSQTP